MNKLIFSLMVAAIVSAGFAPTTVFAQGPQNGKGMHMPRFEDFDLDGDGIITSDEFYKARAERIAKRVEEGRKMKNLANAPSFEDIDVDDDGGVSPDEFAAHQAEHKAKKPKQ